MIKILIVDDELLVRIGLKSTLRWEEYGYTLVGEAKNAKEAIELFDKHSPDILLTDISMPGINGLELISLLKEKNPHLQSIILTHYEDFHYAREAVSLGARDYIVKSNLTPERLLKVLKESEKYILPRTGGFPPAGKIPDGRGEGPDHALFSLLFDSSAETSPRDIPAGRIRDALPHSGFQMALVSINLKVNEKSQLDEKQRGIIEDVSRQVLSENPFPVIRTVAGSEILYLFNFDAAGSPEGETGRISHFMNLLKTNLKKYLNYYLLIGISRSTRDVLECGRLYAEAREAGKRAFFEANHISVYSELPDRGSAETPALEEEKVYGDLRDNRRQELGRYIEELFRRASERKDFDYLRDMYDRFLAIAERFLSEESPPGRDNSLKEAGMNKSHFYSLYDLEAVKMHIVNLFNTIMDAPREVASLQNSYIIRKSIDYINAHYDKNISLNNLARNAEVSRSYLSFLFKQELGVNFSYYLTQTRIRNAKEMLTKTNLKIYEIADRVGFDSPYYFSKVFKETTGITCKEYRNKYYGHS